MSYAMLALFAFVAGYACGRQDRAELGPMRWRLPVLWPSRGMHLDGNTVVRLHRKAEDRRERLTKLRAMEPPEDAA